MISHQAESFAENTTSFTWKPQFQAQAFPCKSNPNPSSALLFSLLL